MSDTGIDRTFQNTEVPFIPKTENAEHCGKSNKKIINNTVFCNLLEQWVSVNYCENHCQAYSLKEKILR